ncbi:MAG: trimethylamine methyltransferase family protein [Ruminococcus sp.]|nr:trimethylamine methyltransferase family protein [Ruminococcus sp.]
MDMTDRFIKSYSQNKLTSSIEIWVDRKTGVNYIYHSAGYSGGLTVLVDKNGKPIVTDPNKY